MAGATTRSALPWITSRAGQSAAMASGVASSGGVARRRTLALELDGGDGAVASCMMFDVAFLKDMSPAFAGTATEVTATSITLDVDRWYAGGDADQVVLSKPDGSSSASLDGVAFEKGERYLVTAANGTVNGCGYSGLATPDLQKAFDEAFPK